MNERKSSRKAIRNPLKNLDRQAYRRAFGEPDAEFHDRVRDTLFLIQEKEEAPVKKKLTFSMAFALVMCICIATAAFAGSILSGNQPDNTFDPLTQSQNTPSQAPTIPNKVLPSPTPLPGISELRTVYFTEDGNYYHTDSICMGMKDPQLGSVAQALNLGKTACPTCMNVSSTPVPLHDSTLVYMTDYNGIYYHMDQNCMNMVGAYYTAFETMRNGDDRPPCPLCTLSLNNEAALVYVWSKEGESHYHADQFCGGTQYKSRTLVRVALNRRQTPCPTCIASEQYTETYYYRADGTFYHADKGCSLTANCELLIGSLTQVKAMERTPCPNCYEPSSTDIIYYAAPAAYSYHTQFTCAAYASSQKGYPLPSDKSESAITFADIFDPSSAYHFLEACSDCVLSEPITVSGSKTTDPGVPLMGNEAATAPSEKTQYISISALDFDEGFSALNGVSAEDMNWSCAALTVHSTIMMHSRGALYTEFEFTLHDAFIDPDTIRIIPYGEEDGSLGCLWANVQQITYDNGETGYLLCQMMLSPSLSYNADRFILYSSDAMLAEFK